MRQVHIDDIETLPALGGALGWKPIRHELAIGAFGINAYHATRAGDLVVEEHADPHQELYVVLSGRAHFHSGEQEFDAPAGSLVLFEPGEHRVAHAEEPGTTVLAIGAEAERFEPSAWEYAFRARALVELGRHAAAEQAVRDGLDHYPEWHDLLYARGCAEAARGDYEAALASVGQARSQRDVVADWARGDPVFDTLAADPAVGPRWRAMLAGD